MVLIRTTQNPTEEREVSEATRDDLAFQGALLGPTRATTDAGLIEAATRQVREANYDDATRAGIAAAAARAAKAPKARAPRKPRPSRARGRQAAPTDPAGAPAVADPANADGNPTGDQASAAVADTPSGDAPADTTQES